MVPAVPPWPVAPSPPPPPRPETPMSTSEPPPHAGSRRATSALQGRSRSRGIDGPRTILMGRNTPRHGWRSGPAPYMERRPIFSDPNLIRNEHDQTGLRWHRTIDAFDVRRGRIGTPKALSATTSFRRSPETRERRDRDHFALLRKASVRVLAAMLL